MRARRQVAMAIWLTKLSSVGVAGWCSASRRSRRASKAAGSSPGRMRVSAYRPYLRLLRLTAARPSGVDGPVLFCALRRLASICRCDDMAHLRRWRLVGFGAYYGSSVTVGGTESVRVRSLWLGLCGVKLVYWQVFA